MKNFYSISEAAKMAGMTSETLRHYDRIGLVKPIQRDEWTGYRYYSEQEIIRLNTIQALRYMDLSLSEIKKVLDYDSLEKIISFLKQAEKNAEEKIAKLQYAKSKIALARGDYEKKQNGRQNLDAPFLQYFPERVILLSDSLESPTLDTLWQYHNHFYEQIKEQKDLFSFEDLAGIYTAEGRARLFAVCIQYPSLEGLTILPAGTYLCSNCTEENREPILARLIQYAKEQQGKEPAFTAQLVVISGILQWNYQIQILWQSESMSGSSYSKA